MNICGIICEYNPFHNGHLFHLSETKKELDCAIVCVMSGNYVQRGEFAVFSKSARAEAAVRCGADLVIELPVAWSIAGAERFAHGAVSLLNALGAVSHLSFGAECESKSLLIEAADILCEKSFDTLLKKYYTDGISFASAREAAMSELNSSLAPLLSQPNNILAIEYLKALNRLDSKISPVVISRKGVGHDTDMIKDNLASASLIRKMLLEREEISSFVPPTAFEIYKREAEQGHVLVSQEEIGRAMLCALKRLSPEELSNYGDVSEGLEYRIFSAIEKCESIEAVLDSTKTKRYAYARLRRILLNAFLGIDSDICKENVPYARLLAIGSRGREIIRTIKKTSSIPIITKTSAIKNEDEKSQRLLDLEKRADDIYALFMKNPISQGSTFTFSPFITD